ncbi:MAG: hypothetical protein ACRDT6_23765 [Micromonosporaceae bacterium]
MQTAGWDPIRGQWVMVPRAFPGYGAPRRPTYREPHPVRIGPVWAGIGATLVWFLFFGLLGWNARSYVWSTLTAAVLAFLAAGLLHRYGDRGVAVGIAVTSAVPVSVAALVVGIRHFAGGDWILW